MDRRPPLAVSPRRLRPRPHRVPRPPLVPASSVQVQTPPGSMKKAAAAAAMRASVCAMRSPVRFEPSQMRASISALSSPVRFEPSPMRASISALPSPVRFEPSPMRASISALSSAIRAVRSPIRASMTSALRPPRRVKLDLAPAAAEKENFLPAAAPPSTPPAARARAGFEKESLLSAAVPSTPPAAKARAGFEKESLHLPVGADAHDEQLWLDLAAIAKECEAGPPVFVRGRNYDRYAARREEWLRRKHGFPYYSDSFAPAASVSVDPEAMAGDPCVAVELSKRRVANKAYTAASGAESVRRSMPAVDFAAGCGGGLGPRSSLRVRAAASVSVDPEAMAEDPCVAVELSKRRIAKKAYTAASGSESVRRSMPAPAAVDFAAGRGGGLGPRSSLRTSKEMKKVSAASGSVSVAIKERRIAPSRSSARRF